MLANDLVYPPLNPANTEVELVNEVRFAAPAAMTACGEIVVVYLGTSFSRLFTNIASPAVSANALSEISDCLL